MVSVEEAVREAIDTDEGPVVLGDLADSGGAGTPGDGTAILAELLKQKPDWLSVMIGIQRGEHGVLAHKLTARAFHEVRRHFGIGTNEKTALFRTQFAVMVCIEPPESPRRGDDFPGGKFFSFN